METCQGIRLNLGRKLGGYCVGEDDDSDQGLKMERSGLVSHNILRQYYARNQDLIIFRSIPQTSHALLFIGIELWLSRWVLLLKPPLSSRCSTNEWHRLRHLKEKKNREEMVFHMIPLCLPAPSSEASVYLSWLQPLLENTNYLPPA